MHYGESEPLFQCLSSLRLNGSEVLLEVIVVNNMPYPLGECLREYPLVQEIWIGKNIGLGAAANRGAERARGEVLLFLNPDTRLLVADTFDRLVQRVQEGENVHIVGAKLLGKEYTRESWGGGKKATLASLLKKRLFLLSGDQVPKKDALVSLDWVSGAVLCLPKADFRLLGGFDEAFFLYFEDMDLCLRAGRLKKRVWYDGSIPILHYGGASFSKKSDQKKHYFTSQKIYFKKHRPAWESRTLEWLHRIFLRNN